MTARLRWAAPLVLLVALAAALRLPALGAQSFWSDEAITALLVRRDFGSLLSGVAHTESTPPLYYVAAWLWAKAAGADETGLRLLSAVLGVLAVPTAYGAARALVSSRAGWIAGLLVAANPVLVWYSQEARAYSLLVLLCGLSFWAFVEAREGGSGRALVCWWLASSLAIATHYFALLVVAVMSGWILVSQRTGRARLAVAGVAVSVVALAPLALAQRSGGHAEYIADSALRSRLVNLAKQVLVGRDAPRDQAIALAVAGIVLVALIALVRSRDRTSTHGAFVAAVVGGAPIVLSLVLVPLGADYVNTQNSLGVVVPLTVALAIAFATVRPLGAGVVAVAAVCVLWLALIGGVARDAAFQRADWRDAFAAAVEGDSAAGGRLVVVGPDYEGWFARAPARVYLPDARSVDPLQRTAKPFRSLVRDDEARTDAVGPDEVVFLVLGSSVDTREAERLLAPGYRRLGVREGDGFQLVRYDVSGSGRIWRAGTPPASLSGAPAAVLYVP
jgi:mannosyltransferase